MAKRTFIELLSGYANGDDDSSGKKFCVETVTGSANRVSITRLGKYISRFFDKFTRLLSYTQSRTYGAMLCVFGLLTLAIHFVKDYTSGRGEIPLSVIIIGGVFSLLSIPFFISDKPLSVALQNNDITDYVFFEFFCIRRMHKNDSEKGMPPVVGVILGVLLAALGAVIPLWTVTLGVAIAVYLFLTFLSPEFSFFSIFLIMPYISFDTNGIFLAVLVAVTLLSYARKVALGKRVYYFEQYDAGLFIMLFCILISGIFVKGLDSFVSSIVMILLGMGYVLASSLVTNRRLADCLINAVIISAAPVSIIAIVEATLELFANGISSFEGVSATFDKPYTLAMFLLVSLTLSTYFIDVRRRLAAKVLYAVIALINFVALFCTMSFWAFGALIIGAIAFAVQKMRHGAGVMLFILSFIAYGLLFIPNKYIDLIASKQIVDAIGFSDSMQRWRDSITMLKENLFLGVGIGEDSFITEINNYVSGYNYHNSGNFLLEIACEAGIISLLAFVMIYIIRLKHRRIYQPYVKNSHVRKISSYTTSIIVTLMVYGAFNYIWADMTMYYLFWCIFGLGSATLRVAKSEFDDRVAYFSDGSAENSSSIDISIR